MDRSRQEERLLPTRRSLLTRLKSWEAQDSWREFFETYWRLIFDTARRAGLDETTAEDVVQETIVAVAKQMPEFRYDASRGSFKGWLLLITKRRIADALRQKYRRREDELAGFDPGSGADEQNLGDSPSGRSEARNPDLDAIWDAEWENHVVALAMKRLRTRVKPLQFQVFELHVLKGWPVRKVAAALGLNVMQVYLNRHRVGGLFKAELERIQRTAQ